MQSCACFHLHVLPRYLSWRQTQGLPGSEQVLCVCLVGPISSPSSPLAPTQAGHLLHSFDLVEPELEQSLTPKTSPSMSANVPLDALHLAHSCQAQEEAASPKMDSPANMIDGLHLTHRASQSPLASPSVSPACAEADALPGRYQSHAPLIPVQPAGMAPSPSSQAPPACQDPASPGTLSWSHAALPHGHVSHEQGPAGDSLADQQPQNLHDTLSLSQTSGSEVLGEALPLVSDRFQPARQTSKLIGAESTQSATSVSQQSISTYEQCIQQLQQLQQNSKDRQVQAAAENSVVGVSNRSKSGCIQQDSSHNGQFAATMQGQTVSSHRSEPHTPPGSHAQPQLSTAAACAAAASASAGEVSSDADGELLPATGSAGPPQLWHPASTLPSSQLSASTDDPPQLSVRALAEMLHQKASATGPSPQLPPGAVRVMPPQLPTTATAEVPQLPSIATALMPGSTTGALLPGTGADLLQRPGSSPLPVSKMLRMVSEDQATLLSDLAAQCAAPGGLLGAASEGLLRSDPSQDDHSAAHNDQLPFSNMQYSAEVCQQQSWAQHAQHSNPAESLPDRATSAGEDYQAVASSSNGQQVRTVPVATLSNGQAKAEAAGEMRRSPLRKRLSELFSPFLNSGSSSPSVTQEQLHCLQQPLLQSNDAQQQQKDLETAAALGQSAAEPVEALQHILNADSPAVGSAPTSWLSSPQSRLLALASAGRSMGCLQGKTPLPPLPPPLNILHDTTHDMQDKAAQAPELPPAGYCI